MGIKLAEDPHHHDYVLLIYLQEDRNLICLAPLYSRFGSGESGQSTEPLYCCLVDPEHSQATHKDP